MYLNLNMTDMYLLQEVPKVRTVHIKCEFALQCLSVYELCNIERQVFLAFVRYYLRRLEEVRYRFRLITISYDYAISC